MKSGSDCSPRIYYREYSFILNGLKNCGVIKVRRAFFQQKKFSNFQSSLSAKSTWKISLWGGLAYFLLCENQCQSKQRCATAVITFCHFMCSKINSILRVRSINKVLCKLLMMLSFSLTFGFTQHLVYCICGAAGFLICLCEFKSELNFIKMQ